MIIFKVLPLLLKFNISQGVSLMCAQNLIYEHIVLSNL